MKNNENFLGTTRTSRSSLNLKPDLSNLNNRIPNIMRVKSPFLFKPFDWMNAGEKVQFLSMALPMIMVIPMGNLQGMMDSQDQQTATLSTHSQDAAYLPMVDSISTHLNSLSAADLPGFNHFQSSLNTRLDSIPAERGINTLIKLVEFYEKNIDPHLTDTDPSVIKAMANIRGYKNITGGISEIALRDLQHLQEKHLSVTLGQALKIIFFELNGYVYSPKGKLFQVYTDEQEKLVQKQVTEKQAIKEILSVKHIKQMVKMAQASPNENEWNPGHPAAPADQETPTPRPGGIYDADENNIINTSYPNNPLVSNYITAFSANEFIIQTGYVHDQTGVAVVTGVNSDGKTGQVEMATTIAISPNFSSTEKVSFIQFRDDDRPVNTGTLDQSARLFFFTPGDPTNIRIIESTDRIYVHLYVTEVLKPEEQAGKPIQLINYQTLEFSKDSPHTNINELLEKGKLLRTSIFNPVTREQINIDEKYPVLVPESVGAQNVNFVFTALNRHEEILTPIPTVTPEAAPLAPYRENLGVVEVLQPDGVTYKALDAFEGMTWILPQ